MSCKYLGLCAGCSLNLPYEAEISHKLGEISAKFSEFYKGEFEIFKSDEWNFRNHAEFGIWHENSEIFYTMRGKNNERVKIETCPKMDKKIVDFMPKFRAEILKNEALKSRLFAVEFIATKCDFMAVLLYHKDIFEISNELSDLSKILGVKILARSRGKVLNFGGEILSENLEILDQNFTYNFESSAFFQSNTKINENMISWAFKSIKDPKDLLEMYCGHGNFTLPLAKKFRKVLANEISKSSIKNALKNCENNGISNINFLRMSVGELMDAFSQKREFNRLKNLDLKTYEISHILVDPPRAGLEISVLNFIRNFKNLIYISCNPATLYENLKFLKGTHKVTKFALFDQFAHSDHLECGVILEKK